MTEPEEATEVAQSSPEPQIVVDEQERVDEISEVPSESRGVCEGKEMVGEVSEISPEPQIVVEEAERVSEGTKTSPEPQILVEDKGRRKDEGTQISPEPQNAPEDRGRMKPSSLRTRPSTRAKRTVTFKDDFEKMEEPQPQRQVAIKRTGERWPKVPPACLGIFLSIVLASLVVYIATPSTPTKPQLWTSAELAKYNGTNNKPPLLLGILGSVFDVSNGWKHYGPEGGYHHFVGRDASRAFVSGNFTGDGLTDSLEGLSVSQIKAIDDWRQFFVSRYTYLGKLVGNYYDREGKPTKKLRLVEKKTKQAAKLVEQQKLDEERFPNCNSRWSQDKGGEVWCNDKYPRIVELVSEGPRRGPPRTRCACFLEEELERPGLKEYDGCNAQSSNCKT